MARKKSFRVVYGDPLPLHVPVHDARKMLDDAINMAKLKKVVELLEQFLEREENERRNRMQDRTRRKFDAAVEASRRAYRDRNPHRMNGALSIPVENISCERRARKMHDSAGNNAYEWACAQSQAAYNARNPHKAGKGW